MWNLRSRLLAPTAVVLISIGCAGGFDFGAEPEHAITTTCCSGVSYQEPPRPRTLLRGLLSDESGKPAHGVRVSLIPRDRTEYDIPWDLTEEDGGFEFKEIEPGSYVVGIQIGEAPHSKVPYGAAYYPNVSEENNAEIILIGEGTTVELKPVRLNWLPMQSTRVIVQFTDGSVPLNSSLLVHNRSFRQATVGNSSWPIHKGQGEYSFIEGFEYYVRASVWCDGGKKIDTRESRPVELIKVEKGKSLPAELKFVVPGPCTLWSPPR